MGGVNWKSRVNEYSGNMLSDGVSFDKAHLQALQTVDDVESCVRAIAILAYKLILRECSEYKNEKVFIREYPKEGNLNNLEFIKIGYSAESENPKHVPRLRGNHSSPNNLCFFHYLREFRKKLSLFCTLKYYVGCTKSVDTRADFMYNIIGSHSDPLKGRRFRFISPLKGEPKQ